MKERTLREIKEELRRNMEYLGGPLIVENYNQVVGLREGQEAFS